MSKKNLRVGLIMALIISVIFGLTWFDGGEEPIRPITQEIAVPEGR